MERTSDDALVEGTVVGRFRIIRHLGRGGMGAVYEAEDTLLERRVAMKSVTSLTPDGRERLLSEARALAKIKHANVVQLHDVGIDGDRVYLALELVRGKTLAKWLAEGGHDWGDIVVHFAAAGRGLAEAHDAGLAHGDFKPSNVLVASDGRVLVSDFGLAQSMEATTTGSDVSTSTERRRRLVGTPAYMAPELYKGAAKGSETDQFAFCVALYEALFGLHPFGGGSWQRVARHISRGDLLRPPKDSPVPKHIRAAVLRGLASSPDARWFSMRDLLARVTGPPPRRPSRTVVALTGLGVAGAATLAFGWPSDPCREAPEMLTGAWDETVRSKAAGTFAAHDAGQMHWTDLEAELDAWTRDFHAARETICTAAQAGTLTASTRDQRLACLKRASDSLRAITSELTTDAAADLSELPEPGLCAVGRDE